MAEEESRYLTRLLSELSNTRYAWKELFSGDFEFKEIFTFLTEAIQLTEAILESPGCGKEKHKVVKQAFDHFDKLYGICDRIDAAVKLPFYLEMIDGKIIKAMVDLLITALVFVLNMTIWKSEESEP